MDPTQEKFRLIRLLDEARAEILAALDGLPEDRIVYVDYGWQVRDVIGHLSMWEKHAATALLAFQDGGMFMLTFQDEDEYNAQERAKYGKLRFESLCEEWIANRERLKLALLNFPPDLFNGIMMHPWQKTGTVPSLIESMASHEREHTQAIKAARG